MSLRPLNTQNSLGSNFSQVNDMVRQLKKEQVTKVFKQPGGNAIIDGKLPYEGGYGSLYYDTNQVPGILIGIAPDGLLDICAAIDGQDVTQLYS